MNTGLPNHAASHPLQGNFNRSPFNPQTRSFVPGGATGFGRPPNNNVPPSMAPYSTMQANVQPQWNQEQVGGNLSRGPIQGGRDSIAKFGTPAHLPPKPPPSEVPSDFELKHRNATPASNSYPNNTAPPSQNGPLVVSGGTGVPRPNQ